MSKNPDPGGPSSVPARSGGKPSSPAGNRAGGFTSAPEPAVGLSDLCAQDLPGLSGDSAVSLPGRPAPRAGSLVRTCCSDGQELTDAFPRLGVSQLLKQLSPGWREDKDGWGKVHVPAAERERQRDRVWP